METKKSDRRIQRTRQLLIDALVALILEKGYQKITVQNIIDRAKKKAVKRSITHQEPGIKLDDILEAVREEFKENEDLPNTTNPDDWARISGRKGEKIINVRTLLTGISRKERSIENVGGGSGQYL